MQCPLLEGAFFIKLMKKPDYFLLPMQFSCFFFGHVIK